MAVKTPPDGYSAVTPMLIVRGATGLIEFMEKAFSAEQRDITLMQDGSVGHAELTIGGAAVMVSDATDEFPAGSAAVHLYLPDVDQVYQRAVAAGGTTIMAPTDQFYGDRSAMLRDAFGNLWSIATHMEDVSDEEMQRRLAAYEQP